MRRRLRGQRHGVIVVDIGVDCRRLDRRLGNNVEIEIVARLVDVLEIRLGHRRGLGRHGLVKARLELLVLLQQLGIVGSRLRGIRFRLRVHIHLLGFGGARSGALGTSGARCRTCRGEFGHASLFGFLQLLLLSKLETIVDDLVDASFVLGRHFSRKVGRRNSNRRLDLNRHRRVERWLRNGGVSRSQCALARQHLLVLTRKIATLKGVVLRAAHVLLFLLCFCAFALLCCRLCFFWSKERRSRNDAQRRFLLIESGHLGDQFVDLLACLGIHFARTVGTNFANIFDHGGGNLGLCRDRNLFEAFVVLACCEVERVVEADRKTSQQLVVDSLSNSLAFFVSIDVGFDAQTDSRCVDVGFGHLAARDRATLCRCMHRMHVLQSQTHAWQLLGVRVQIVERDFTRTLCAHHRCVKRCHRTSDRKAGHANEGLVFFLLIGQLSYL